MDVLPADAEVTIDHAGLSACDAMLNGADATELFGVEIDQFAWAFRVYSAGSVRPAPGHSVCSTRAGVETRLTAAGDTPVSAAIYLPVHRWRRSRSISSTMTWGVAGAFDAGGISDHAIPPFLPCDIKPPTCGRSAGRRPAASAAASGVCPLAICRTIRSRPRGVSRAFLWAFIRSSRESLKPRNSSFLGQDRVDNLMKAQS